MICGMTQHLLLMQALGDAAYSTKRDDWRTAISTLRAVVAPHTSKYRPLGRRLFLDHRQASSLLDFAANVGEQVHKGRRKEDRARRALLERAVIANEPDLPTRFPFVMRPVIDDEGHGRLEVVGPRHADGEFIIHYAFCKNAEVDVPPQHWASLSLLSCDVPAIAMGSKKASGALLRVCEGRTLGVPPQRLRTEWSRLKPTRRRLKSCGPPPSHSRWRMCWLSLLHYTVWP